MSASTLDALLDRLPRTTLIVGKGGVGKTTCAAGIAAAFAARDVRTVLVSTDPAGTLGDVLGVPLSSTLSPVAGCHGLEARQLEAAELRRAFLDRWRATLADIVDRGTYLDRSEVDGLIDAALPGADEVFALLALAELLADPAFANARVVVDTAPTGHTLRLLALPDTFLALVAMLDMMQGKYRFMVRALTRRYRRDSADEFIDEMRARIDGLRAALTDGERLAAILVTRVEPMVLAETKRYLDDLRALRVRVAALVVNAIGDRRLAVGAGRLAAADFIEPSLPSFFIAKQDPAPTGLDAVRMTLATMTTEWPTSSVAGRRTSPVKRPAPTAKRQPPSALRTLTIVAGKGGVGKTTVACALAIGGADAGSGRILLVSTDPAPSIADALGYSSASWAHADQEFDVPDVPGLVARQMDAAAAFAQVRDRYQARIDALFDALIGRGVDARQDHAILRDLLALAPPGVDELFALSALGDALAEERFGQIVVDPAPTGHLLRLLDMPAIALDWTHRLMRLMLKYRDVVGLGDTAEDLLEFAKRTRALDRLLRDHASSGVVVVSLDEPVVRAETARLAAAVDARGIDVTAIIWNRTTSATAGLSGAAPRPPPLPPAHPAGQFCAGDVNPPPIGVAALREWLRSWHPVSSTH